MNSNNSDGNNIINLWKITIHDLWKTSKKDNTDLESLTNISNFNTKQNVTSISSTWQWE